MKNQRIVKVEQELYYNTKKYKQKHYFYIFNDISDPVTLEQLLDSLVIVNHDIAVFGYWIFDSQNEKELVINRESLDNIFATSVGEEKAANFDTLFYDVRYIRLT